MKNETKIWNYFYSKLRNEYGVAALMGNLMAESSLSPKSNKVGTEYTKQVDNNERDFVNDGVAYGLAQWCYYTRKQGLLDLARKNKKSVGDIDLQLDYIWQELQSYKTVLRTLYDTNNIREASDVVMLRYEKPANKSEAMKKRRATYGEGFYQKYKTNISIKMKTAVNLFDELQRLNL